MKLDNHNFMENLNIRQGRKTLKLTLKVQGGGGRGEGGGQGGQAWLLCLYLMKNISVRTRIMYVCTSYINM